MKKLLILKLCLLSLGVTAQQSPGGDGHPSDPHRKCYFHGQFVNYNPIWKSCIQSAQVQQATSTFDNYLLSTKTTVEIDADPKHDGFYPVLGSVPGVFKYTRLAHDPDCWSEEVYSDPYL